MKTIILISTITLLALASCSKNDSPKVQANAIKIVGVWHETRNYALDRDANGKVLDTLYDIPYASNDIEGKVSIAGNGMIYSWGNYNSDGTVDTLYYKMVDDSIYISDSVLPAHPYLFDGHLHSTTDNEGNITEWSTAWIEASLVKELTESKLILSDTGSDKTYSIGYQSYEK